MDRRFDTGIYAWPERDREIRGRDYYSPGTHFVVVCRAMGSRVQRPLSANRRARLMANERHVAGHQLRSEKPFHLSPEGSQSRLFSVSSAPNYQMCRLERAPPYLPASQPPISLASRGSLGHLAGLKTIVAANNWVLTLLEQVPSKRPAAGNISLQNYFRRMS